MNQNIVALIVGLVAVNLVLITVAVVRSLRRNGRRRREAYLSAMLKPIATADGSADRSLPSASSATSRADSLTGLLVVREWNRLVADEDARVTRYGHPATVVIMELDGLERLNTALGRAAGARGADQLARIGPSRFGILLPETGEVDAVNYVERIRQASDLWLESGAIALRLSIGWASPGPDASLLDAVGLAHERMFVEQRRGERAANDIEIEGPPPVHDIEGSPSPA
jgi:diguanylate cyclase (GGDEF)-like protein